MGQACLSCNDVNISEEQFILDGGAAQQYNLIKRSARILGRKSSVPADITASVQAIVTEAQANYVRNWNLIWSLSSVQQLCPASAFCVEVNNAPVLDQYTTNSEQFIVLGRKLARLIVRHTGKVKAANRLKKSELEFHQLNLESLKLLPLSASSCSFK